MTAAIRTLDALGICEEVRFIGPPGRRMLTVTHTPKDGGPRAGVIICSSLHAEFLGYYRKEVLLARALARQGFAVQRFQYLGSGNSEGSHSELTFETMCEDGSTAVRALQDRTGVDQLAFVGVRLGALAAAATARPLGAPLVLWEPPADGAGYFRQAFRARMMRDMKDGVAPASAAGESMIQQLQRVGSVDVLGYSIDIALYESVRTCGLEVEAGSMPKPVLLVQISRSKDLKGDFASLVGRWRQAGFAVQTLAIIEDEAWWFVGEDWRAEEDRSETTELVGRTGQWLETLFPPAA